MFEGYFPVIDTYQTLDNFCVKRTKKTNSFWKLAPRLSNVDNFIIFLNYQVKC